MAGKVYGNYLAQVVNDADPENKKRLLVKSPYLFNGNELGWARACLPPQFAGTPPKAGEWVYIFFEMGELDKPVWMGQFY
ncbi:hypothetical protein F400_gp084 [Bacillus phage BCD7]|uniref:Gp5/Type VI secretion system Vgr protein OB-fold domain-containing protein n=1 Tax=Bacillus phage BCD7 TaxID=1136534 RepID=J9PUM0_9CAUD|nr:hypothetical protein F400_gp084 [Bacillus phage BCD7]AEZ50531.1 hypothetical protein BCD7_0084 [Bacillus phage BCD7]